ncbi:MAG: sialate O-acetylesterase, partial [Bacteroidota bacterium]
LFQSIDGAVWFRKTFEIPLPFRGKDLKFNLGQMDDHDIVWVNGQKIGSSSKKQDWRNYFIEAEHLKEGQNEIVVRIFDFEGNGGYVTDPYFINFHPVEDSKGYYLLSGDWKYKIGKTIDTPLKLPYVPANEGRLANITPSSLYQQMIHPLRHFSISGAIWYQGESNSSRGYEYQHFFPNMIKSWRTSFDQGDFPFLFVQLPNFRGKNRDGSLSNWPELRQAQTEALKLPNTGMAVTIDIGLENNIHPPNKQDVGHRLALAAFNLHYKKNQAFQGPTIQKMKQKRNALIITFEHTGEGLQSSKTGEDFGLQINNFEIAGADDIFYKAQARIIGKNQIKVWTKEVTQPINVRYAWKNNPSSVNLYNNHGLPAPPFRTGNWEWETRKNKYVDQIK